MADCTPDNFRIRFPEFEDAGTYPDARVQLFIDDATATVNGNCSNSDLMICYLAAHLLLLSTQTATGNTKTTQSIASKAVDGVSVSYNGGISDDVTDNFYSTAYGQRYVDLRNNCIGRPIIG